MSKKLSGASSCLPHRGCTFPCLPCARGGGLPQARRWGCKNSGKQAQTTLPSLRDTHPYSGRAWAFPRVAPCLPHRGRCPAGAVGVTPSVSLTLAGSHAGRPCVTSATLVRRFASDGHEIALTYVRLLNLARTPLNSSNHYFSSYISIKTDFLQTPLNFGSRPFLFLPL